MFISAHTPVEVRKHRLELARKSGRKAIDPVSMAKIEERNAEIKELYLSGKSLQEVGDLYDISRERVRQIVRRLGVSSDDGGQGKRRQDRLTKAEQACRQKYGLSLIEYRKIKKMGWVIPALGRCRRYAKIRALKFNLTLGEWWRIWIDSGHAYEHGRGKYGMRRFGDTGDYEIGNVYIESFSNFHLESIRKDSDPNAKRRLNPNNPSWNKA